jgi:hypothetical protein
MPCADIETGAAVDLTFVIDRLKAQAPALKTVGGSADMESARPGAMLIPSAFVFPIADSTAVLPHTGGFDEADQWEFGVVLVVANLRDARGAAALTTLAPIRAQVRAALSGWAPDTATGEPVTKGRGQLLRFDGDNRLWWIDRFHWKSFYRRAA